MSLLERYILREHLVPFLIGFCVVTFLLSLSFLYQSMDLFITKEVPAPVVIEIYVLALGWMVALSIPCATLVASLMTFGRMAQDNEVTALRAAGLNLLTVLRLPLAASCLLAVGLTLFNNHILPETNHAFANLMVDIARKRPAIEIQEGVFINDFPGYSILIHRLDPTTSRMENVTIYELNPNGMPTTIIAKRGQLYYSMDGATLTLELEDGEIHEVPDSGASGKYRRIAFARHVIHIQGVGSELERTDRKTRSDREMSTRMMLDEIAIYEERQENVLAELDSTVARAGYRSYAEAGRALNPSRRFSRLTDGLASLLRLGQGGGPHTLSPPDSASGPALPPAIAAKFQVKEVELKAIQRRVNSFKVEIHKKFAIPVACVVFVLVGAPLGIRARRGGVSIGFLSVAFFLFYYVCLIGGEQLADRAILPPWLAMWIANAVLGTLGIILTLRTAEIGPAPTRPRRRRGSEGADREAEGRRATGLDNEVAEGGGPPGSRGAEAR